MACPISTGITAPQQMCVIESQPVILYAFTPQLCRSLALHRNGDINDSQYTCLFGELIGRFTTPMGRQALFPVMIPDIMNDPSLKNDVDQS
jgi:hypothetical protein